MACLGPFFGDRPAASVLDLSWNFLLPQRPTIGLAVNFNLRTVLLALSLTSVAGRATADDLPVDFENDIQPVLTRFGCNSGPCHGKARGQGGFQLSLLGFDSDQDFNSIVKEGRGRRVFAAIPDESLLLAKPTGGVAHGGGVRFSGTSSQADLFRRWIVQGMPRRIPDAPTLVGITVKPDSIVMVADATQQLQVTAQYSDGSERDVTSLASFQSSEAPLAAVSDEGLIRAGNIPGEAAVMGRFRSHIAVCNVLIPRPSLVPDAAYEALPRNNFIDGHVWDKLKRLQILPSELCDDATFIRRATTDIIGRMPTAEEVDEFLAETSPDRRSRLIDRLLENPEYADFWANKWVDLLRPNPYRVGIKAVFNYDHWIRQSFHDRKPWDHFVRELVTARGSTFRNGAVTLFRDRREPEEITTLVSQLFVGVRLDCARCHHHPFEVWGQEDFFSFAAYFAEVGRKGTGLSPPISGSEEFFFAGRKGVVRHPVTGEVMKPAPLFGEAPPTEGMEDIRESLATWLTSPDNHLFSQVMANRVWMDLMTRGLVEPVDDFRATNPASNAALLEALGNHFRDAEYSIPELIRVIANSHVYQLSSIPNETNEIDGRGHSRHYRHRHRAEVLLDSLSQLTEIPQRFAAMPPDTSSRQIWTHRTGSLFLDTFGRPDPNQDPPCERTGESTVVQSLHLMNSEEIYGMVTSDKGFVRSFAGQDLSAEETARVLYRRVFSRDPDSAELQLITERLNAEGAERCQVIEDFMWAMLNSAEFVIQN